MRMHLLRNRGLKFCGGSWLMIAIFVVNLVIRRNLVNNKNGVFISQCMLTRGFCLSPVDVAVYPELASF